MKNGDVIVAWVDKTGGSYRPSLYPAMADPVYSTIDLDITKTLNSITEEGKSTKRMNN